MNKAWIILKEICFRTVIDVGKRAIVMVCLRCFTTVGSMTNLYFGKTKPRQFGEALFVVLAGGFAARYDQAAF
jgi:hypothetical protein|tara:strand:- start:3100 stop:3318 length:219 start_codon:yes stop_codon:yes gene_type:complete